MRVSRFPVSVWPAAACLQWLARTLFSGMALALAASQAHAQAAAEPPAPDVCHTVSAQSSGDLEALKQRLEREVAAKPNDRKAQEALLDVMFRIECARKTEPAPALEAGRRSIAPRSPPPPGEVIEITTFFATNRKPVRSLDPTKMYGPELDSSLHYGRAVVTVPLTRPLGGFALPRLWKLEREPDPRKHFVLRSIAPLEGDAARQEIAERLKGLNSKSLLVFVHGYNTGFGEAALRTAQMVHDLQFPGLALFFTWPSAAQVVRYWQDEETARYSEGDFEQLIDDLSKMPATDIYVVAHSMGNRVVGHALQARVEKGKESARLRQVLLAAPDVGVDIFRSRIAPKLTAMQGTRTTIYAASSDIALKISKVVHGFRRVGETTGGVFTYPGLETIDASSAAPAMRAYGHLYVVDSPSVLKDIQAIIDRKWTAKLRGLPEMGTSPNSYFRLP
jgi:esterase/lipase superfamily enzyme